MITRRRLLAITAAAIGSVPFAAGGTPPRWRWHGHALGGPASLTLFDHDRSRARATVAACVAEVERLENEFSLYRADSALRRLNRDRMLPAASLDMQRVLTTAHDVSTATGGAFDITVQPQWESWAAQSAPTERRGDYRDVGLHNGQIRLKRPGMALTLNGIAQGYITDRVSTLLQADGYSHVLIDLGEIRALGPRTDGQPWRIGLAGGRHHHLETGALATSAMGQAGTVYLNPATGLPERRYHAVTVSAPTATEADALSTGFSIMAPDAIADIAQRRNVWVRLVHPNGQTTTLGQEVL